MHILQGLILIFFTFFITPCASKFNSGLVLQYGVLYRLLAIIFNPMSVLKSFLETKHRGFVVFRPILPGDFGKIYHPQNEHIFIANVQLYAALRVHLFTCSRNSKSFFLLDVDL